MKQLIKALDYQTKQDNFTIYAFMCGAGSILMGLLDFPDLSITGGYYTAAAQLGPAMGAWVTSAVLASRICSYDMGDRTINYEVMAGHSRRDVYFSRVIVSLLWCLVGSMIMLFAPAVIFTLVNGWGEVMDIKGAVLRYLLMFFPILRLICAYIFICFLARSFPAALAGCFAVTAGGMMIYGIGDFYTEHEFSYELAVINMGELTSFNSTLGYIDGKDTVVYDATISAGFIAGTMVISIIAGAVYLFAGYALFMKRDMR